jgi:fatty-acyl-CoA synthase
MHTCTDLLIQACQDVPERTAITLLYSQRPEQNLSYQELLAGAARYALALDKAKIHPGDVVIIIHSHGEDLVFSFFGALLHGAIPSIMPFLTEKLSPDQYRQSLTALITVTSPGAVITYPEFVSEVENSLEGIPTGSSRPTIIASDQLIDINQPEISWESFEGVKRRPEDIVLLQHSSGTTGLQKGVALSHRAVLNQIKSYGRALRLNPADVVVSWLPLYHDMGLIAGFILPILSRNHLVLLSPFDWIRAPYRFFQAVTRFHGTLSWLPNFAYNFCAQKTRPRDLENVDLSTLRALINCSEPMHWKSHQMFLERFRPYGLRPEALATCYAMAENVFAVTQAGITETVTVDEIDANMFIQQQIALPARVGTESLRLLSAGKPIDNTKLRILGADGNDLLDRHVGEIALVSDCMLSGYYHRPDLTEKAFLQGWYLTGDLGYLAEGEIYVTGRKKDLIIVGGKNIYPQDLERLASEVEGVHAGRVVAFGVFDDKLGTEEVVLVAEIDGWDAEDSHDTEAATHLSDQIRQRVTQGSDIALRQVHLVERNWLLKTSSGKIARSANRDKWKLETQVAE